MEEEMSDTITDMPKVAQMLDAGWEIECFKNGLGSYTARAFHPSKKLRTRVEKQLREFFDKNCVVDGLEYSRGQDWEGDKVETDDFTPEQALTRLAYKVHGEILI